MSGVLALLLAAAAPPARAVEIVRVIGPLHISGKHPPMTGPVLNEDVSLERGWIKRYWVRLLDEKKAPEPDQRFWCHTAFHLAPYYLPALVLGPGLSEIAFPEGTGFLVRGKLPLKVSAMLQSEDAAADRRLYFELHVDFQREGDGPPPKTLWHYAWAMDPKTLGEKPATGWHDWWVPPGRHAWRQEFTLPCAGQVHFATTHLHRYASRVRLLDAKTEAALLDKAVLETPARVMVETPLWSDASGFPLAKDHPYVFEAVYDNPLKERVSGMATVHLFFHPSEACELPPPVESGVPVTPHVGHH